MVKKLMSLMMVIVLSFGMIGTVSASNVSTYDINGHIKTSTLTISNKRAICISTYQSTDDECASITVVQTLEKHSWWVFWDTVGDECTKTVYTGNLSFTNYKDNLESGTYRVKTEFSVTLKNGKSETVTVYSDEKEVAWRMV